MERTTRSALIVLILVLGRPSFVEACPSVGYHLPRAVQCTDSVNLSVAVDKVALYPKDRERAEAFERHLQAKAIQTLGENRIAVDPKGQDGWIEPLDSLPVGSLFVLWEDGEEERLSIVRLGENESPEKFSVTDDGLLVATPADP